MQYKMCAASIWIYSNLKIGVCQFSIVYSLHLQGMTVRALLNSPKVSLSSSAYLVIKPFCTSKAQEVYSLDLLRYLKSIWDKEFPWKIIVYYSYGDENTYLAGALSLLEIGYLQLNLFSCSGSFNFRFRYLWKCRCYSILNSFSYCYFYNL